MEKRREERLMEFIEKNELLTIGKVKEIVAAAKNDGEVLKNFKLKISNGERAFLNYVLVLPSGKIYFGQTSTLKRFSDSLYRYGRIGRSLQELECTLSDCALVLLSVSDTRKEALEKEEDFITRFNATNPEIGLNIAATSLKCYNSLDNNNVLEDITLYENARSFVAYTSIEGVKQRVRFSSMKACSEATGLPISEIREKKARAAKSPKHTIVKWLKSRYILKDTEDESTNIVQK